MAPKKKAKKAKKEKAIGKVVHWYDKIDVAVVKLASALKVGDRVRVKRGEEVFEDTIASMQFDHKPIKAGKKGHEIAVMLSKVAKEGAQVFKA